MSISANIKSIYNSIPSNVKLVSVSKYHPVSSINEAYNAGFRIFGESKVQEIVDKHTDLPKDIEWHFIGHLQTNKVKYLVSFVNMIHAVDSEKLIIEIEKQASKIKRKVNCLLQIHIAQEENKYGFYENEIIDFLNSNIYKNLEYVNVCGLMSMATNTDDVDVIRNEFRKVKALFDYLKSTVFKDENAFVELSVGMSNDYQVAIEEGSTMIRIGSAIFGQREY